jgi:hypothetical protein
MILPTERKLAMDENPKFTVLFGKPKSGKTTIASGLQNALIIDTEGGSDYVDCMSVQVRTIDDLKQLKEALIEANKAKGEHVYTYGVIDTATKLEDISLDLALALYKNTPMGKTFKENDIRGLPNGGGYLYIREAYKMIIDGFKPLFKYLILLGHTKDKTINKQGKELSENCLDLSGKLERIISADADALGYVYRQKNQTIINFNGGGDFIVEARPSHIRGKEIVIAESNAEGKLTMYWDKIFI